MSYRTWTYIPDSLINLTQGIAVKIEMNKWLKETYSITFKLEGTTRKRIGSRDGNRSI
jgi:hypothetical protein